LGKECRTATSSSVAVRRVRGLLLTSTSSIPLQCLITPSSQYPYKSRARLADSLSSSGPAFCPMSPNFVLRKMHCFCSFQRPNCAELRAKRAQFAAFEKVMSFVFKHFLASFPRFSYLLVLLPVSLTRAASNPAAFPPLLSRAKPGAMLEDSNSAYNARITHSIAVRLSFVLGSFFKCLSLFSTTYWLRSFYFLFVPIRGFPKGQGFPAIRRAWSERGTRLRQCVHKMTTIIGYHLSLILSSGKCGNELV